MWGVGGVGGGRGVEGGWRGVLTCKGCCMHLPTTGKQQDPWTCSCCGCVHCLHVCLSVTCMCSGQMPPPDLLQSGGQRAGKRAKSKVSKDTELK